MLDWPSVPCTQIFASQKDETSKVLNDPQLCVAGGPMNTKRFLRLFIVQPLKKKCVVSPTDISLLKSVPGLIRGNLTDTPPEARLVLVSLLMRASRLL